MARYRTFKPELFADEKLTACSVDARFLFLGLLPFLDDMGRRQYHPRRIKAEVFPADEEFNVEVVEALVQELAKVGVIELYDIRGKHYLRVPNFLRHQYVRKPGHCYVPPSPTEGPNAERCRCLQCKAKIARNNGDDPDMFLQELPHEYRTSELPVTHEDRTGDALVSNKYHTSADKKGREGKGRELNTTPEPNSSESPAPHIPPTNAENRRAQYRALQEIATRMLSLLQIKTDPSMIETLTRSIEVKAKSKQCSPEAAAQQIAARAALLAVESPPENWADWLFDVRYEYLAASDTRLQDRRIEARPTCGGTICSEGWETVTVNGTAVLRRCPDCVKLWACE